MFLPGRLDFRISAHELYFSLPHAEEHLSSWRKRVRRGKGSISVCAPDVAGLLQGASLPGDSHLSGAWTRFYRGRDVHEA